MKKGRLRKVSWWCERNMHRTCLQFIGGCNGCRCHKEGDA